MTAWGWFLGAAGLVVLLTLVFAGLTARSIAAALQDAPEGHLDPRRVLGISRGSLYANAVASQGLLLVGLLAAVVATNVDWGHLGLDGAVSLPVAIALGAGLGLALAGLNEASQAVFDRVALSYDESLRRLLTPSSPGEWAALVFVVLPVVAVFEELLFRGALIGAAAAGLDLSPWLLVVGSSVLFALGHGLQGVGGLVAAGALGLVLGGAFVASGSLALVVVAHYVINLLEFVRNR